MEMIVSISYFEMTEDHDFLKWKAYSKVRKSFHSHHSLLFFILFLIVCYKNIIIARQLEKTTIYFENIVH